MLVMPGMTQDQRKAAGDSYRQFQQRLFGNRQQTSSAPVIGNAPNGRPVTGAVTTAPQPTKAPDMSAYSPGRAQPQQPRQGTPYGRPPARPAQPRPQPTQSPANIPAMPQPPQATPYGWPPGVTRESVSDHLRNGGYMPRPQAAAPQPQSAPRLPISGPAPPSRLVGGVQPAPSIQDMFQAGAPMFTPFSFTMPMGPPSLADLPPDQRPPGFTQTFTDPFGNQTQNNPMAQRDALIQLLNQQSLPYYMGKAGQFNPNLQELWGQAGNMTANGWTNPLAGMLS